MSLFQTEKRREVLLQDQHLRAPRLADGRGPAAAQRFRIDLFDCCKFRRRNVGFRCQLAAGRSLLRSSLGPTETSESPGRYAIGEWAAPLTGEDEGRLGSLLALQPKEPVAHLPGWGGLRECPSLRTGREGWLSRSRPGPIAGRSALMPAGHADRRRE